MVAFGSVQKRTYTLIETGEYVFTLNDVGETSGDFGDRMVWDFLVGFKETPTDYIANANGDARVLRFWTDQEITVGSKQHQWIQALAGREFGVDDRLPDGEDILGKRMVAYLTHYTPKKGKNAGVPKEDIVMGSAKRFVLGGARASSSAQAAAQAPDDADDSRDALIASIKKAIRRAALADVPENTVVAWKALDLSAMGTDELRSGLADIEDAITAMAA